MLPATAFIGFKLATSYQVCADLGGCDCRKGAWDNDRLVCALIMMATF